ncbi:MAG: histidine phosphatase family protein [Planctomycetes bacterium]|nr:histidine phosphatase family protein [Planctomycetota bacterium]
MSHRTRLALVFVLVLAGPAAWLFARPQKSDSLSAPITVVLVRHAEKATDDPKDPSLSDAGRARAVKLAKMLASAHVSRAFCSEFRRTHQTVEPTALAAKVDVTVVSAADVDALIAQLRALAPGSTALVAAHSNTAPKIAAALGVKLSNLEKGPGGEQFPDAQFDRLVVLTLPTGENAAVGLLELSMGD